MRASDLLITKAGPGTLAEASVAQLPVVVYDYVPGQERGNLDWVRNNGVGVVALSMSAGRRLRQRIVLNGERLAALRTQLKDVAPRGSSRRIAALIGEIADRGAILPAPFPVTAAG